MNNYNHKRIEIYNANHETLAVNPFSSEQKEHSGRIIYHDDDFENISLMRFQFDMDFFDFLTRPHYIKGKKVNLSSYFSINQFQTGILDVPFISNINELDMKIQLKYRDFCTLTFFENAGNNKLEKAFAPKSEVYALINNTSTESHKVNIIDLAQGINVQKGITIENSNFDVEKGNDFKLMRVWSKTIHQINEPISIIKDDKETIVKVAAYWSAYQLQNNVLDVPYDFNINSDSKIMVNIASKAKVFYNFL